MYIFKEEYMLGQSEVKNINGVAESLRLDLSLSPNPYFNAGTLTGIVKDSEGKPIAGSVVVIMNEDYSTFANTIAGSEGTFLFNTIKPNSNYYAFAKAPGYKLSETQFFTIDPNQYLEVDFELKPDLDEINPLIAGIVQDDEGLPANTSSVELYKVNDTETKSIALTFTNEIGQFILSGLTEGSYFLKVDAQGYFSEYYPVVVSKMHEIIPVNIILKQDLKASKGIITGVITDNEDQPLPNADVVLYRVGQDGNQNPVAYTRSNLEGIYLFVNVPHGQYSVNANRSVTIK